MTGFINVIKPKGISSARVVTAVKKKFHVPCGHMGTLDPMASGVLPVGVYKTSRLFDYLLTKQKTYVTKVKFGVLTDTLDVTGKIVKETSVVPTKSKIQSVLKNFVGEIDQVPPAYSAKCINATWKLQWPLPPTLWICTIKGYILGGMDGHWGCTWLNFCHF